MGNSRGARSLSPRLTLLVACLALFVSTLDNTVVNVALPQMGRSLHAGGAELQWVVDSYLVVRGCLLMSAGALSDRFGRRRTFLFGLGVFGLGSLCCSLSPSAELLTSSRVLQAVGGCFLVPSSLAIIADAYPDAARRARAIGVWNSTTALSTGLGPPIGGLLVVTLGWRSVFWINLPIVAVAMALIAFGLPAEARQCDPRPGHRRSGLDRRSPGLGHSRLYRNIPGRLDGQAGDLHVRRVRRSAGRIPHDRATSPPSPALARPVPQPAIFGRRRNRDNRVGDGGPEPGEPGGVDHCAALEFHADLVAWTVIPLRSGVVVAT